MQDLQYNDTKKDTCRDSGAGVGVGGCWGDFVVDNSPRTLISKYLWHLLVSPPNTKYAPPSPDMYIILCSLHCTSCLDRYSHPVTSASEKL